MAPPPKEGKSWNQLKGRRQLLRAFLQRRRAPAALIMVMVVVVVGTARGRLVVLVPALVRRVGGVPSQLC
jgi:hypothetical protein